MPYYCLLVVALAWKDLPSHYFSFLIKACIADFVNVEIKKIFKVLGKDTDMETLCIDLISIKAHQQSAGAKKALNSEYKQHIGISRGGKNTKIYAIVNALGNSIKLMISS